jgi:DNA-binding IclR family transcriptional regulator
MTVAELATAARTTQRNVLEYLGWLARNGLAEADEHGRWTLTPAGSPFGVAAAAGLRPLDHDGAGLEVKTQKQAPTAADGLVKTAHRARRADR